MSGRVVFPPKIVEVDAPLIFLAGPTQGAINWQEEAIRLIHQLDLAFNVASPRRERVGQAFGYTQWVDWKTRYSREAAKKGAILFWLPRESEHDCASADVQTSWFELGEWKARHEHDGVKLVVGIDRGFTGARYIQQRLSQDCLVLPIVDTLKEACEAAVALARFSRALACKTSSFSER